MYRNFEEIADAARANPVKRNMVVGGAADEAVDDPAGADGSVTYHKKIIPLVGLPVYYNSLFANLQ